MANSTQVPEQTIKKIGKGIKKGYMGVGKFIANNNEIIGAGLNVVPNPDTTLNSTELISGQVYDKASDWLMTNPTTALFGLGMKGAKKADLLSTATDFNDKDTGLNFFQHTGNFLASLTPGSKLFSTKINPVDKSRLNGIASYTWHNDLDKYNNKGKSFYVAFGGKEMKKAANDYQLAVNTAIDISDEGTRAMKFDPYQIAKKSEQELAGGFDARYGLLPTGKQGTILQFSKRTLSKNKIVKQQSGGSIKHRTLDELVDYVEQKNPPFWERMSGQDKNEIPSPFGDGGYSTLLMNWSTGDNGMAEVFPSVQYDNTTHHLKYIQDWREALDLARKNGDVVIMTPEEAENFTTNYKKASKLKHVYDSILPQYTETFTGIFKEGGRVNVIPEGALHKNKHHLEDVDEKFGDGSITTKGIPVIVESDGGEVIQQAEVERQEIIFRLEVTKKLEELAKEHTDKAAIEAGKLLVKEILYNTVDNTQEMI